MEKIIKIVKKLCEVLYVKEPNFFINSQKLADLVGCSKERLLVLIVKCQSTLEDKIFRNLFCCDYNPFNKNDEGRILDINLTTLGKHAVQMNDESYWKELIEGIYVDL